MRAIFSSLLYPTSSSRFSASEVCLPIRLWREKPLAVADGQKTAVVAAHLLGDQIIELRVHGHDKIVVGRAHRQIVDLLWILLQIIELQIVMRYEVLVGRRRVEIKRR